ncbi:MAG: malto-oligosyltrehalose trehalohydrolase [Planctomycetes bacterium]|nr:malto-oligosyltrehalose trehalohydrolase [Planctomycetota bacterium]
MRRANACCQRRFPIGAEVFAGGVSFRVWAPRRQGIRVALAEEESFENAREVELRPDDDGYFAASIEGVEAGMLYRFLLDDDPAPCPDPASRFQPHGPHGPSQIVDPSAFAWTDQAWRGVRSAKGQVIYEMHIGTFTPEGTWAAAGEHLADLAGLGVTILEIMPVGDFPGRFGWGYDGVNLFAPTRLYGTPDDFRRFVDRAHGAGLAVILDVVYNHVGPDGNFLPQFSEDYFTDRYPCDWGKAINFDGPNSHGVREFVLTNVSYWLQEFHLDGLRIDATQQIFDESSEHIIAAIARTARAAAPKRVYVVGENEPQHVRLVQPPEQGGYGLDSLWNDDFHHSAMVAVTGRADAYYSDYRGAAREFLAAAKWGFLYQGQYYSWQKNRRGTPSLRRPPTCFVHFIQNHDQLANSGSGERFHRLTSPSRYRALTALLLLLPQTPMLFQGQEFGASTPFFYFADHHEEIARQVAQGRADFLSQFRLLATPEMQARLPDPGDPMTFARSKIDPNQRRAHAAEHNLHQDLLRLRREDPVFARQEAGSVDGEIAAEEALVLRFFGAVEGDDRLLIVNLGRDVYLAPAPLPLLAPPADRRWEVLWTSEDARYGGWGSPPPETETNWRLQGEAALVLRPSTAAVNHEGE